MPIRQLHVRPEDPHADSLARAFTHLAEHQLTCAHHNRRRFAQNADHLTPNGPFLAFSAEVVCTLGATPPRTAT